MLEKDKKQDLSKLPKWARFRIQKLERDVTYYKEQASQVSGDEETDTSIRKHLDENIPLPKGAPIEFALPSGVVTCRIKDSLLELRTSSGRPIVIPDASNNFYIEVRGYYKE